MRHGSFRAAAEEENHLVGTFAALDVFGRNQSFVGISAEKQRIMSVQYLERHFAADSSRDRLLHIPPGPVFSSGDGWTRKSPERL